MEFVICADGLEYEVRIAGAAPGVTVDEVLGDVLTTADLEVDGAPVPGDAELHRVARHGCVVSSPGSGAVAGSAGTSTRRAATFHRPPRSVYPMELPPIPAPARRDPPAPRTRFGWAALIVPIVLGGVLAVLIHPRMALFAVFSPAMALANWVEDRRRVRHGTRQASRQLEAELADFGDRLRTAVGAARHARMRDLPELGVVVERIMSVDDRLWERRHHHDDAMRLSLGTACIPWAPVLEAGPAGPAPEAAAVVRDLAVLHDVPVDVTVVAGAVVGIAGDVARRRGVARSLLIQAAALHGPADLQVTVVTDEDGAWDWAKWLPHVVVDPDAGLRRLAATVAEEAAVLDQFARPQSSSVGAASEPGSVELLIVDVADLASLARKPLRDAIDRAAAGGGAVIAVAATVAGLPSRCSVIAEIQPAGVATLRVPDRGVHTADIVPWLGSASRCRAAARALAGIIDPELDRVAAPLPGRVRLIDLLGMPEVSADTVAARWARNRGHDPAVPVGMDGNGTFSVSLVADGPHALLAGTTGSGKSELLRSLVASLAAHSSPDDLTFVLVDYKGGSAFDVCSQLPHTVGIVTDLDGGLAQRALTCLEAELRHREEQLRAVGASDLTGYRRSPADEPLPRLLVIVDEFAALAKELPEFMASLIDIAQRGRSLGVHLILATQRPQGVINDQIRANTNLRMALRVQDAADSADVIGTRDAAGIGRHQPGRGYARLGVGDITAFQAALVTGAKGGRPPVSIAPFVFAAEQRAPSAVPEDIGDGLTDLDVIVAAATAAHAASGRPTPRRPWPDPLPGVIPASELAPPAVLHATLGLADEPSRQRRRVVEWSPGEGSLLLYGITGSGTSTALGTIAVGLARSSSPDDLHLYALDFDDQLLAPLDALPHTGAVVSATDRERQLRLVRMLLDEIERRRSEIARDPGAMRELPTIVLLLDNYGGFSAAFDDAQDLTVKASMARILADGPGVGLVAVITAKQPVDVPAQVASLIPARLLFRLADRFEYAGLGVSGVAAPTVAGRCYESWTGREVQVARWHVDGLGAAVALVEAEPACEHPPPTVGVLPQEVKVSQIDHAARIFDLEWTLPAGLGDMDLEPVGFTLGEGDHAVVAGPARSGKSTALATLARVARQASAAVRIVAIAPRRSVLRECAAVDDLLTGVADLPGIVDSGSPLLVLIDDAMLVDDAGGIMAGIVDRPPPNVHVIAAAPADTLRSAYGHWTAGLRRSRLGLVLRPNPATDGDLWHTALPRRGPANFPAGRGYLVVEGRCELVQVASL